MMTSLLALWPAIAENQIITLVYPATTSITQSDVLPPSFET